MSSDKTPDPGSPAKSSKPEKPPYDQPLWSFAYNAVTDRISAYAGVIESLGSEEGESWKVLSPRRRARLFRAVAEAIERIALADSGLAVTLARSEGAKHDTAIS